MYKSSILLAGVLALQSAVALGKTVYVDNSCAQNGNGATTTCGASGPWNSLNNITCSGLTGGDIVEIRGRTYRAQSYSYQQWSVRSACSGSAGNPIIIQNYANENVLIEGTREHVGAGETWTQVATGVWESSSGAAGLNSTFFPFGGWYKASSGSAEEYVSIIQPLSTTTGGDGGSHTYTCNASVTAGRMTYQGSTGKLCVHLQGGANPVAGFSFTTPVVASNIDYYSAGVANNLTIRRNPAGGSFTVRRAANYNIDFTNNSGLTWDGLNISGCMNRCLSTTGSPSGSKLLNSTVSQCGQEGAHWQDAGQYLMEGNTFTDVGGVVSFPYVNGGVLANFTDGCTGIRVSQGPASGQGVIRGNTFANNCGGGAYGNGHDLGGRGIDMEANAQNILVESNYLYQTDAYGAQGFMAIALNQDNSTEASTFTNLTFRNNRTYNTDYAVQLNTNSISASGSGNAFQNNTFVNYQTNGVNFRNGGTWTVGITWTNNLFAKFTGSAPAFVNSYPAFTVSKPTFGSYYCPSCSGNIISGWSGSAANTQSSVQAYDPNSQYGDPNISASGAPPTLKIVGASGSAYNRGTTIATFSVDFEGNPRPYSTAWDIGADEYTGAGLPAPTLLSVEPLP